MTQTDLNLDDAAYNGPIHYFASCALGWATADTRDQAVRKVVAAFRADMKRATTGGQKRGDPGAYVWSCKVQAPADTKYSINYYAPQNVRWIEGKHHYVTYITQKAIAYCTTNANLEASEAR